MKAFLFISYFYISHQTKALKNYGKSFLFLSKKFFGFLDEMRKASPDNQTFHLRFPLFFLLSAIDELIGEADSKLEFKSTKCSIS